MPSARRRRQLPTFSMSFLDIMFCGFGAVVLLVLILNSHTVHNRKQQGRDLRGRVNRLEMEVHAEKQLLAELKNSLSRTDSEIAAAENRSEKLVDRIMKTRKEIATYWNNSLAKKESINRLQSDLKTMDAARQRLLAEKKMEQESGEKARHFSGEGNRQYLTGLRLEGKRILLLMDSSASMLDRTVVDIIRKRNMSGALQRRSPKWQRAIRTARWLLANLPADSSIKIATFNTGVKLLGESSSQWVQITSRKEVDRMVEELEATLPSGGTSLFSAFSEASRMTPGPDNILLLTDGLPTVGAKRADRGTVSSEQRVRYFLQAASRLPRAVPVNTILFPLEGDPMAAGLYWKLAVNTRGSFMAPSRDWP